MKKFLSPVIAFSASFLFIFSSEFVMAQGGSNCVSAENLTFSPGSNLCNSGQLGSNTYFVWYKFTAIQSAANFLVINDPNSSTSNASVSVGGAALYSGTCSSLFELPLTTNVHGDTFKIFLTSLRAGTPYFLKLEKFVFETPCANCPPLPALNYTVCTAPASQTPWQITGNDIEFDGAVLAPSISTASLTVSQTLAIGGSEITHTLMPGPLENQYFPSLRMTNAQVTNFLDVGQRINFSGTQAGLSWSAGAVLPGFPNPGTLLLSANTSINGSLDIGQARMGFVPASGGNGNLNVLTMGKQGGNTVQASICNHPIPSGSWVTQMNTDILQFNSTANGNTNQMNIGYDGLNNFIEAQGTNQSGSGPSLLMDYYCGKDVAICTNSANGGGSNQQGGVVGVGKNLEVGLPIPDYSATLNLKTWSNNAIKVQDIGNTTVFNITKEGNTLINSTSSSNSPFTIQNSTLSSINKNILEVGSNGTMTLSTTSAQTDNAFDIWDLANGKSNFRIKTSGHVYAREVIVSLNQFPDYVFAREYKLTPIGEVKKYTETFGHLENMPTAKEVEENGANLGEIQRVTVEKVEEIFLYVFELTEELKVSRKEEKAAREEIEMLKARIKKLESK